MGKFEGNKFQVRCTDCTKLSGNRCIAKDTKVKPKKKRICTIYNFKGKYENSTPIDTIYIPYIEKKTIRLMKKLMKMGVLQTNIGETQQVGGFEKVKTLPMPVSTATTGLVDTKPVEDLLGYQQQDHVPQDNSIAPIIEDEINE